jgi:hypothetical protein
MNLAMPSATSTGNEMRGLFAVLRTVSPDAEDLERLTRIALAAKESGAGNAEVAEQIKTSIPRLKPLADWLLSPQGAALAAWLAVLASVWMLIVTLKASPPAQDSQPKPIAPTSQTIIVNCPYDQEQMTRDLLGQIAREIRSIESSETKDRGSEPRPDH